MQRIKYLGEFGADVPIVNNSCNNDISLKQMNPQICKVTAIWLQETHNLQLFYLGGCMPIIAMKA